MMRHATPTTARSVREIHARMKSALPKPCEWQSGVCLTRATLYRAVLEAEGHEVRYPRAVDAWKAHHCTIEAEEYGLLRAARMDVTEPVGERLGRPERAPTTQVATTADPPAGAIVREPVGPATGRDRITGVTEQESTPAGHPLTLAIRAYTEAVETRATDHSEAARDRVGDAYVALWDAIQRDKET
jgi:hypothetical protein